jgi:UDPglucose 6-dehydrogenase
LADRIQSVAGGTLARKKIIRDAAALTVSPELHKRGTALAAFDPVAMDNGRQAVQSEQWCADAYSAALGVDVVVILTEWNVLRGLDLGRLARDMREPVMVDFPNLFSLTAVQPSDFIYQFLGRSFIVTPENREEEIVLLRSGAIRFSDGACASANVELKE